MVFGQKVRSNLRIHRVWQCLSCLWWLLSLLKIQHYIAILEDPKHTALEILFFMLVLIFVDLQTFHRVAFAPVAFEIRACTSAIKSPSIVILLPIYHNLGPLLYLCRLTDGFFRFCIITLVLVLLIFRRIFSVVFANWLAFFACYILVCVIAQLYHRQNLDHPSFPTWSSWFPFGFFLCSLLWSYQCRLWRDCCFCNSLQ